MGNVSFKFKDIMEAVEAVYGSDPLEALFKGELTSDEIMEIIKNHPEIKSVYNKDGSVAWRYIETTLDTAKKQTSIGDLPESIKVAASAGTNTKVTVKTPVNITPSATTAGKYAVKSGLTKTALKVASRANAITGTASLAYDAASAMISVGKGIEKALYDVNPDFWDAHGMETLDPTTWGKIVTGDDLGSKITRFIYQIETDETGDVKGGVNYISEKTLGLSILYAINKNGFKYEDTTSIKFVDIDTSKLHGSWIEYGSLVDDGFIHLTPDDVGTIFATYYGDRNVWGRDTKAWRFKYKLAKATTDVYIAVFKESGSTTKHMYAFSAATFEISIARNGVPYDPDSEPSWDDYELGIKESYTFADGTGKKIYTAYTPATISNSNINEIDGLVKKLVVVDFDIPLETSPVNRSSDVAYLLGVANKTYSSSSVVKGITDQTKTGLKTINADNCTDVESTLNEIYNTIPQIADNRSTLTTIQDDGTITTETYVPVAPVNTTLENAQPTTSSYEQWDDGNLPTWSDDVSDSVTYTISPEVSVSYQTETAPQTKTRNTETTGSGNTPSIVLPSNGSSGLWAIYNPSESELKSFGAWLWSDSLIEQIKKLFSSPMDAIIGVHKVYSPVVTSGTGSIQVGYINSGVSSAIVSEQYVSIDCGSIDLYEYFGNVFDYDGYTNIQLYLPFIGIVPLQAEYVMRSTISITYKVDVLTGTCLAMVNVKRDGSGGVIYQYSGNCAVTYPISSGSYMGIVSSILGMAGSIAGGLASGGIIPMIAGLGMSATNAHTSVQHSGSFSGNSGAMGAKIPYLIISRPITALPDDMERIIGISANQSGIIGEYDGYTEFSKVILKNINCFKEELLMIESLLLQGVYL